MNEPIDVESTALAVREPPQPVAPVGLFGDKPGMVVARATEVATALKDVIRKQGLISKISGKEYPRCEAWTLLGTMIGVFPVLCWCKEIEGGFEARVEAKTMSGAVVGAAEAVCLRSEKNWSNRETFALKSMAQTRATAKALRMPLGFVMTLAGYEATPAEEMAFEAANGNRPSEHPQAPKTANGMAGDEQIPGAEVTGTQKPIGLLAVTGVIQAVSKKSGNNARGPWTSYGIKVNDGWFNTFSKHVGERADSLKGESAEIWYEEGERGNTAVAITHDGITTKASDR